MRYAHYLRRIKPPRVPFNGEQPNPSKIFHPEDRMSQSRFQTAGTMCTLTAINCSNLLIKGAQAIPTFTTVGSDYVSSICILFLLFYTALRAGV